MTGSGEEEEALLEEFLSTLSPDLRRVVDEFPALFGPPDADPPPRSVKHHIYVSPDSVPAARRAYPLGDVKKAAMKEQMTDLVEKGWVVPSSSPWAAPILFVPKDGGTKWRMCVDFRDLNALTKKDAFPLPRLDILLHRTNRATIFSKIDLASGFHQIEVHPRHRELTAFILPEPIMGSALWEWKVMPFGLVNAPPTFRRAMTVALRGCEDFAAVYIDDVLVFSANPQQHLEHLRQVFKCLQQQAYHVRLAKCEFMASSVRFLGHVLSADGIGPAEGREKGLAAFQPPFKTPKQVKSFLGMVMWFRTFIPHVATLASPLFPLTSVKKSFAWTPEATKAVEALKQAIIDAPLLARFDRQRKTRVTTDASTVGIGAVLEQWYPEEGASPRTPDSSPKRAEPDPTRSPSPSDGKGSPPNPGTPSDPENRSPNGAQPGKCDLQITAKEGLPGAAEKARTQRDAIPVGREAPTVAPPEKDLPKKGRSGAYPALSPEMGTDSQMGIWRPVAFWSRKLKDPETRYSATDIEWLAVVDAVSLTWRHFLEDIPFVVRSDHKALERKLTKSAHEPPISPRQSRWIERLLPYSITFEHVAGTDNIVADALSRYPCRLNTVTVVHSLLAGLLGRIRLAAESDPSYQAQKGAVLRGEPSAYRIEEDLLIKDGGLIVIPQDDAIRTLLMSEAHDPVYSGHFGLEKTLEKIRRTWHWSGMVNDVRMFVRSCPRCQRTKHDTCRPPGLLQPILSRYPWQVVTMDFVGKFTPAEGTENNMCLVMVDKFTKYVLLEAVPETITASQTAEIFIRRLVAHFGVPATVISDRGPQFTSAVWKETLGQLGTQVALASSHHPQTDGQTERTIQTLLRLIRAFTSEKEETWEKQLPLFQYALNDAYCEATQTSPFRALYGKDPMSPLSLGGRPK